MTDTAKVAELLQDASAIVRANEGFIMPTLYRDIDSRLAEALRALGEGEGVEEWTVGAPWRLQSFDGYPIDDADGSVAVVFTRKQARRIAALPRLERAAREVVFELDGIHVSHAIANLRAALDEPGGQS